MRDYETAEMTPLSGGIACWNGTDMQQLNEMQRAQK
jgi:hypothetical protein